MLYCYNFFKNAIFTSLYIFIYLKTFTGPKQNTVADFWLMIWQKNVEQVVMLTNLMEGNKVIMHFFFIMKSVLKYFIKQLLNYMCIFYSGNAFNIGQIYKHLWIVVVFLYTQWKKRNMHFTMSGSLQSSIKRFDFVTKNQKKNHCVLFDFKHDLIKCFSLH